MAATPCIYLFRYVDMDEWLKSKLGDRVGRKGDLSDTAWLLVPDELA